jgi:GNAT superfamily N-acetyltransferase
MQIYAELMTRWQRGWSTARDLPAPEAVTGGLLVRCDQRGRLIEVFALDADSLPALAAEVAAGPGRTWLTVASDSPDEVEAIVTAAGLEPVLLSERLMSIDLAAHPERPVEAPYRLEVTSDGPVITAQLLDAAGETAAHGTVGLVGTDAVPDRIETMPEHRRRGLGSVLMGALAAEATRQGAKTGLLIASEEGQYLYGTLGWQQRAVVLIAGLPPAEPAEA